MLSTRASFICMKMRSSAARFIVSINHSMDNHYIENKLTEWGYSDDIIQKFKGKSVVQDIHYTKGNH